MLYEITVECSYFDQQVINRWTYNQSGAAVGITAAAALLAAFGLVDVDGDFPEDTPAWGMQRFQPVNVIYRSALVKALYDDPTDFIDRGYAAGVTGVSTATNPSSPALAFGFKTNRVRTDIARGTKRIVGVDELAIGAGGAIDGTFQPVLNTLADLFSETLTYTEGGSSLSFLPCVLGRKKTVVVGGPTKYEFYPTLSEQLEHTANGVVWQAYTNVRTQVSRQYGHGR